MTDLQSHHPNPVEAAWLTYEATGRAYQEANAALVRSCLMGLAITVRDEYPTATHMVLEPSDQGPYLTFTAVIDPECGEDDNEVEEPGCQDALWTYAGDLDEDDPFGRWQPFVIPDPDPDSRLGRAFTDPTGRSNSYVLDIDLILFCEGDSERAIALMEEALA